MLKGRSEMTALTETTEYYCVNCQLPLHEFVPSDRQEITY